MTDRWMEPWTADEDAALREMIGDGCTDAEVGGELGRSRSAVERRRRRLGISVGKIGAPVNVERRSAFLSALADLGNVTQAGRRVGLSKSGAVNLVLRLLNEGAVRQFPIDKLRHAYQPVDLDDDARRTRAERAEMVRAQLAMSGKKRHRRD